MCNLNVLFSTPSFEMSDVYYKGSLMVEVQPYERCPFKVGILVNNEIRFFKFAPP